MVETSRGLGDHSKEWIFLCTYLYRLGLNIGMAIAQEPSASFTFAENIFFQVSLNISVKAMSESTVLCDISETSGNIDPLSSS